MTPPMGCDTFVVMPEATSAGIIFGKNSDRPSNEVQEIVYIPETETNGGTVKIEQVSKTLGVILSKPGWMWGAEMGANSAGVVIGNEYVDTKVPVGSDEALTGMDLVRLGLERAQTARDAVNVITSLIEKYGQGGPCTEAKDWSYYSSFLLADPNEAWVLETAGRLWVAEKVKTNTRNISNCLTIGTDIDLHASEVKTYAIDNNLWDGQGDFNWTKIYSTGTCDRFDKGKQLLNSTSQFSVPDMFKLLRNTESNICMTLGSSFVTTSSQVSLLLADKPSAHWFTGTPDPTVSVFKPFIFTPSAKISQHTIFKDNTHNLYKLHQSAVNNKHVLEQLREMESNCTEETTNLLKNYNKSNDISEFDELFKDVVETEVKFYK